MNKLNKIFLGIIIILVIVIGIITYYCYYLKNSYVGQENNVNDAIELEKNVKFLSPDIFNMEILEDTVTPSGATLRVTYKDLFNKPVLDIRIFGYALEGVKGDTYEKLEPITIDLPRTMFFNTDTQTFEDQVEIQLDWSKYYGELPKGKYHFSALVYLENTVMDYGSKEFEIK